MCYNTRVGGDDETGDPEEAGELGMSKTYGVGRIISIDVYLGALYRKNDAVGGMTRMARDNMNAAVKKYGDDLRVLRHRQCYPLRAYHQKTFDEYQFLLDNRYVRGGFGYKIGTYDNPAMIGETWGVDVPDTSRVLIRDYIKSVLTACNSVHSCGTHFYSFLCLATVCTRHENEYVTSEFSLNSFNRCS